MRRKILKKKNFKIKFYESLIKERPYFFNVLIRLSEEYTKRGFYEKGLELDKRLVELKPDDPIIHYNLACSLSLLGKIDEAFLELKKAFILGYDDFYYMLKDPDLENLRKDERFNDFFNKVKRIKFKTPVENAKE